MSRPRWSERWKSVAIVLALIGLLLLVAFVSGGAEPDFIPAGPLPQSHGPWDPGSLAALSGR